VRPLPALLLLALAGSAASAQEPPPTFAVNVEVVRVDVAVTRGGAVVDGLGVADFELYEDGKRQKLDSVLEERNVPLEAALVLDLSLSVRGRLLEELRRAALAFLDDLRPEDQAELIGFSHQVGLLQPLTADLDRVRRAVRLAAGTGSTALRDAVFAALAANVPSRRRPVVVVFSDGVDNASWLPEDAVEEAARRSSSVVYSVVSRPADRERPTAQPLLARLARATGGRVWESRNEDLRRTFVELLRHVRGRYLLTYTPPRPARPGWHDLQVRLHGVKGDVLARPGYFRRASPDSEAGGEPPQ
jgi:Ca-activated chloride channel family protein